MADVAFETAGTLELTDVSLGRHRFWRDSLRRRMLAGADAIAVILMSAFIPVWSPGGVAQAFWAASFVPVWLILAKLFGLYDRDHRALRHLTADELPSILAWALTGAATLTLTFAVTPAGPIDPRTTLFVLVIFVVAVLVLRFFARFLWRHVTPPERVLIVGQGLLAATTRRKLELFPDMHLEVVRELGGCASDEIRMTPGWIVDVERVIIAHETLDEDLVAELIALGRRRGVKVSVIPPANRLFPTAAQLAHVADLPIVEYNTWDVSRSTLLLKRGLDVAVSALGLVLLLPLFALVALAIRLDDRGPILFRQVRAGRRGEPFRMVKFRTMVVDAEDQLAELIRFDELKDPMFKLRSDPRITRVGRLLRRTSLDELPQLWNVLCGYMSLVGPRPEQLDLVERYGAEHRFRLILQPGITGPMQVYGRGELSFEERLAVEREYIENLSIGRDLRMLLMTFAPVFTGRGAF